MSDSGLGDQLGSGIGEDEAGGLETQGRAGASEQVTGELMDRWYAAWNAHDVDAIAACLTEDVVVEDPSAALSGRQDVER